MNAKYTPRPWLSMGRDPTQRSAQVHYDGSHTLAVTMGEHNGVVAMPYIVAYEAPAIAGALQLAAQNLERVIVAYHKNAPTNHAHVITAEAALREIRAILARIEGSP